MKVEKALNRLRSILPLKAKQEVCGEQIKALHQQVLRSFVECGQILSREEMADYVSNLEEAIRVLSNNDMVVFSENGNPVGAYPFTMDEREHKVQVNGHQVFAMCALDALAVSPMFGVQTQIISQCRVSGMPVRLVQSGKQIENLGEAGDTYLGIAWGAADKGDCVADSLCLEMIFLKDSKIAQQWREADPETHEIFTLSEAIEFADLFFSPLVS